MWIPVAPCKSRSRPPWLSTPLYFRLPFHLVLNPSTPYHCPSTSLCLLVARAATAPTRGKSAETDAATALAAMQVMLAHGADPNILGAADSPIGAECVGMGGGCGSGSSFPRGCAYADHPETFASAFRCSGGSVRASYGGWHGRWPPHPVHYRGKAVGRKVVLAFRCLIDVAVRLFIVWSVF